MIPVIATTIAVGGITLAIAKCCFNRSVNVSSSNGRASATATNEAQIPITGLMKRKIKIDSNYIESKKQKIQGLEKEKDQLIEQLNDEYIALQKTKATSTQLLNDVIIPVETLLTKNKEDSVPAMNISLPALQIISVATADTASSILNMMCDQIKEPSVNKELMIALNQLLEDELESLSTRNSDLKTKLANVVAQLKKIRTNFIFIRRTAEDALDVLLSPKRTIAEEK